jgi:hypothetical protein
MDPSLLEKLVQQMVHNEITGNWEYWFLMLCVFLAGFIGTYFIAYAKKRAEDDAALIQLREITQTVEEIKSQLQDQHTLRFAALEKRLQAHQEAFTQLINLASAFYSEREHIRDALKESRVWYAQHALYLEDEAKSAFNSAFTAAQKQYWRHSKENYKLPDEHELYQTILAAQDAITKAVGLPPLRDDIAKTLRADEEHIGDQSDK